MNRHRCELDGKTQIGNILLDYCASWDENCSTLYPYNQYTQLIFTSSSISL